MTIQLIGGPADKRMIVYKNLEAEAVDYVHVLDLKATKRKGNCHYYYSKSALPGFYVFEGRQNYSEWKPGRHISIFGDSVLLHELITPSYRLASASSHLSSDSLTVTIGDTIAS